MSDDLRSDAWAEVYLDRGPLSLTPPGPEQAVEPRGIADPARDAMRLAVAVSEAQEQAQALKEAVGQAEAILENCRELLDALRAILTYPSAYGWEKDVRHLSERPARPVAHASVAPPAVAPPSTTPGLRAS